MDIQVTPVNFNASQDLIKHMAEVFKPLEKFHDRIVLVDIYLESTPDEKSDKLVKIKILIPGHEIFIQHNEGDFVSASQVVYDKVKRQLKARKEQDKDHHQARPDKVY